MSEKLIFLHDLKHRSIDNDKKMTHEEFVIHGSKGLTIKYFHKDDKTSEKIVISERDGKYMMKSTIGESHEEKELSKDELVELLTKNKSLKFALSYVKGLKGSASLKRSSKKSSKKVSKKGSKKGSKKVSKKGSKKGSKKVKKGSKKMIGGKKSSKKASKKGSKKSSKKI